ncbi:MAG: hypothetical protein M1815_000977 [Lichina confinis]|nr:MAG: hypothetical protein M1815_000977 [Lichina confinis]
MASELTTLEHDLKEYKLQLETVQSGLQADPDNTELQNLKAELEEVISLTESAIAELKPVSAPERPKQAPLPPPPPKEKWSRENHPAFQSSYRKAAARPHSPTEESATATTSTTAATGYAVNDTVLAKWVSGDNAFYPARITSITGSSNAPVYAVTFKNYGTTETLSAKDLKPISNDSKKRKADGSPANPSSATSAAAASSSVISAAADINPALANQARHEPSRVGDGPPKPAKVPRKVKANKELEAGKSKWQDFTTKGKSTKTGKKDSMFRTPDGIHGRVGFTGSGQQMRKDPTRSKHIYQQSNEDEHY